MRLRAVAHAHLLAWPPSRHYKQALLVHTRTCTRVALPVCKHSSQVDFSFLDFPAGASQPGFSDFAEFGDYGKVRGPELVFVCVCGGGGLVVNIAIMTRSG